MKMVYKNGRPFIVRLETERNGVNFALLETPNRHERVIIPDGDKPHSCWQDTEALRKAGGFYLMWGPSDDTENYYYHGISSLRKLNNYKLRLPQAMKAFFQIVKDSDRMEYKFSSDHV